MPNKYLKKSVSTAENGASINVVETSINSPLQRFVRAKKKINQTFDEIFSYLKESRTFLVDCEISEKSDNDTRQDLRQVKMLKYFQVDIWGKVMHVSVM